MLPATFDMVKSGSAKKGDVLGIARIAAIQASKRTSELIPLCHPIPLTRVAVEFELDEAAHAIRCTVTAETVGGGGSGSAQVGPVATAAMKSPAASTRTPPKSTPFAPGPTSPARSTRSAPGTATIASAQAGDPST